MSVAKPVLPTSVDANFSVTKRIAWAFAPHEQAVPDMSVALEPGAIFYGTTLQEIPSQSTTTITAPIGNPRIDRVVIDQQTGAASVITGTAAANPIPPAFPGGKIPVAQIRLEPTSTTITNDMIMDERIAVAVSAPSTPTRTVLTSGSGVYTPPSGCTRLYVRLIGAGGGGAGANANGTPGNNGLGGNPTTFGSLMASGGAGGKNSSGPSFGGAGGTASGGDLNFAGSDGGPGCNTVLTSNGGDGGGSVFGGRGVGGLSGNSGASGSAPGAGGGGGGSSGGAGNSGGGGGAGAYCEAVIAPVAASYSYAVGAGGPAGSGNQSGGAGYAGIILIDEYYV